MKTFQNILKQTSLCFIAIFCFQHFAIAQDSKKSKDSIQAAAIKVLVDAKTYVFQAQSVRPMKGGNRQLSPGYTLNVSSDTITCDLPYFGRMYTATIGSTEGGIKFTSTDFEYKTTNRKKGGWDVKIKPKKANPATDLTLTIYDNGSASLYVTSNDRQSISYSGYIEERKSR